MSDRRRLDEFGREILDPTPVSIPAGFKRPETMEERVQRLVRTQLSAEAAAKGEETFEESEDFEVGDDFDPSTPYETFFDPTLGINVTPQEFAKHEPTYRKRYLKAQQEYFSTMDREGVLAENLSRARYKRLQEEKPDESSRVRSGNQPDDKKPA